MRDILDPEDYLARMREAEFYASRLQQDSLARGTWEKIAQDYRILAAKAAHARSV